MSHPGRFDMGCVILGEFIDDGKDPSAQPIEPQPVRSRRESQLALAECLANQALIEMRRGNFSRAVALLQEQREICQGLNELQSLQACLGNLAQAQRGLGNESAALELFKEQEMILRHLTPPSC